MVHEGTLPLPTDPALAVVAAALRDGGHWAEIVDCRWRYAYVTDDLRLSMGGVAELAPIPLGAHYYGPEAVDARRRWRNGPRDPEYLRPAFRAIGGWMLADTPGGRDELRGLVDHSLSDIVDELSPTAAGPAMSFPVSGAGMEGIDALVMITAVRIHDATGRSAGTALIAMPAAGMAVLATAAALGDLQHFERMQRVAKPARRPTAILFADLEASSDLARRMSTASFFALGRRLVRAADGCVIDAGGLVGRHVGDGVAAFFLAEAAGCESAAARACIAATHALRSAVADVAEQSGLAAQDLTLRFGLHWGATAYVGQITTRGRTEVTALGDEINEAARIEACATGGRALASKALVEHLSQDDAAAVGVDAGRVTYVRLADLTTATEKARRDAPAISVCEV